MKRAVAEQYRDTFPNSDLVDVPGAGHTIYWERPDAFLATVRSFLR
jgi:N-formylmaleamate deformylase